MASFFTRRRFLASGAIIGFSASLQANERKGFGDARCPHCLANLTVGDLHREDCPIGSMTAPEDSQIDLQSMKYVQAQRRSSEPSQGKRSFPPEQYGPPDPCPTKDCDRCRIQYKEKVVCYHKDKQGHCAARLLC